MERLEIVESDFYVYMSEKNKLYKYYGKDYANELPRIYRQIAKIFNSDNFFTDVIERRLKDRNYNETALKELELHLLTRLYYFNDEDFKKIGDAKSISEIKDSYIIEKINKIFSDQKEKDFFDIMSSITNIMFNNCVYDLLSDYVRKKEPALTDCSGVEDYETCDFIIDKYHQFISTYGIEGTPSTPLIDEKGNVIIEKGDVFHGTSYSEDVIESMAYKGLESGQLHGVAEDGETFFCVDFFKANRNCTIDEVCRMGKTYTNGANRIVFVIRNRDLKGENAMFPSLTNYDAYDEESIEGKMVREIVNLNGLPLNKDTGSSILMGIPACMISAIIVNSKIENDLNKIEFLSSHFPKAYIVGRSSGMVIKQPIDSYQL